MRKGLLSLVGVLGIVFSLILVGAGNDIMNVEADILTNITEGPSVSIQVPEYVNLGSVKVGGKSEELRIFVNNTGSVDLKVTPVLVDSSERIFRHLYFRGQKTKTVNGTATEVPFDKIGDFSFTISKPTAGKAFNDEDFYMVLDLKNYTEILQNDLLRHATDVKFIAVAQ